jgi:hypothetical protein
MNLTALQTFRHDLYAYFSRVTDALFNTEEWCKNCERRYDAPCSVLQNVPSHFSLKLYA